MKKFLASLILCLIGLVWVVNWQNARIQAQERAFTPEELAQYNGQNGQPVYVGFEGKVYDFSVSKLWAGGKHFELTAGQDLTGKLGDQHGAEVIKVFPVVGVMAQAAAAPTQETLQPVSQLVTPETSPKPRSVFPSRLRFLGITILGWTGILMGIFFVLTFGTCFAMPWARSPVPWKGSQPGADPQDSVVRHLPWTSVHQYFVWFTVVLGIIHGVLGFLQLLGIYL